MTTAAAPITYGLRANATEHEAIWTLEPDALTLTGGGALTAETVLRFPYRNVAEVQLSFAPTRADRGRYRCRVRMRSGQSVEIISTHYAGIMNFEDRSATYTPFVRELVARIAAVNPDCRFRSGKSPIVYLAEHLFLFTMFGFLVTVLIATADSTIGETSWLKLGLIGFFLPVAVLYTKRNWPRRFTAQTIPADVLPSSAENS